MSLNALSYAAPPAIAGGIAQSAWLGSIAGESMRQVESAASAVIGDSKEEFGQFLSSDAEKRKLLDERALVAEADVLPLNVAEIEALLDPSKKFDDPDRLHEIIRSIQQSRDPGGTARKESSDPRDRFALLQLALRDGRTHGLAGDALDRLQDAINKLANDFGPRVRAGLNSTWAAREFASTPQGVRVFQHTYADVLLGKYDFDKTLSVVLERLAGVRGADFPRALKALLGAVGADLTSAHPSVDSVRLQALMQTVYRMEIFVSLLEGCATLADVIASRFGIVTVDPVELMKALVTIIGERWVLPARLKGLADRFKVGKPAKALSAFHNDVWNVLHDVPEEAFADRDARQGLLDASRAVIDEAAAQEEEEAS